MHEIQLKQREYEILRSIAHAPRTAVSLTHIDGMNGAADLQCAPHVIRSYLARLCELGLIEPPQRADGRYCITEAGAAFLAAQPRITPSRHYCNASVPSSVPYRPPVWNIRESGRQAAAIASRGTPT